MRRLRFPPRACLPLLVAGLAGCGEPAAEEQDSATAPFVACEGKATALDPGGHAVGWEGHSFSAAEIAELCEAGAPIEIVGGISFDDSAGFADLSPLGCVQAVEEQLRIDGFPEVPDLRGLAGLRQAGELTLDGMAAITSLSGLETLAPALGAFNVSGSPALTDLSALECANSMTGVTVNGAAVTDLSGFSGLRDVDGSVTFSSLSALEEATLPSLESARLGVALGASYQVSHAAFPALEFASELSFSDNYALESIEAPVVRPHPDGPSRFTVHLNQNLALVSLVLGEGDASVPLELQLISNPKLHTVTGLGAFAELESLYLSYDAALASLPPLAVTHCAEDLTIEFTSLQSLDFLSKLGSIGGDLSIVGNPELSQAEAEAFAARLTIGGTVTIRDNGE